VREALGTARTIAATVRRPREGPRETSCSGADLREETRMRPSRRAHDRERCPEIEEGERGKDVNAPGRPEEAVGHHDQGLE